MTGQIVTICPVLLQLNCVHSTGSWYNTLMNEQTLSQLFGDRARMDGSVIVLRCSEEEERKMLAKWLMQLSFADELGRDYCGLGWSNGEVRMEAIGE